MLPPWTSVYKCPLIFSRAQKASSVAEKTSEFLLAH